MPKLSQFSAFLTLTSLLALVSAGCDSRFFSSTSSDGAVASTQIEAVVPPSPNPVMGASPASVPPSTQSDLYQQAIDRASSAFILSRSAQSQDDWMLVVRRWQQAIDLLTSVPAANPRYAQAQTKLKEYRTNLAYAQQQANQPTTTPNPDGTIIVHAQPSQDIAPIAPVLPPSDTTATRSPETSGDGRVFYAPIVRREGNTPVIQVTFNGNQTFEMIVDTGASGTLITQQMAEALDIVTVGTAFVDTASERGVSVPLGYVNTIEVDGAVARNVLVAIAGPQLGVGLLGHDFFGNYDVIIRENEVEFRER
ncbi:MAG: aspartyl protease [Cyanobacteria bacterium CRU_2_1]|nr:aspartyl protease [Cyanobacteria bacterium RU_5_0]NJR63329.1 aspartyl protease [Cyanobacteria bacterium CRU_2_1]